MELDPAIYADKNVTIMYWQGPIVNDSLLPGHVARLSYFRTEIHDGAAPVNETTGNMVNTPAMTSAAFGKGRVVLNSPHPELAPTHPNVYAGELAWVLGLGDGDGDGDGDGGGADDGSSPRQTSCPSALSLVQQAEGYKGCTYVDTTGHKTICYGFNLDASNAKAKIEGLGLDWVTVYSKCTKGANW